MNGTEFLETVAEVMADCLKIMEHRASLGHYLTPPSEEVFEAVDEELSHRLRLLHQAIGRFEGLPEKPAKYKGI